MNMADILIISVLLNCRCDLGQGIYCGILEMRVPVFEASSCNLITRNLD